MRVAKGPKKKNYICRGQNEHFSINSVRKYICRGRDRKTHVSWHCRPENFYVSVKFLRVSMKSTLKRHDKMHRFPDVLVTSHMVWKLFRWSEKFTDDGLESLRMVWKVPRWSGIFQDCLESSQMVWKVFVWSGNFTDGLESFRIVWKVSRWYGKFTDGLESFWMVRKLSRPSGIFPDHLESFDAFVANTIYTESFDFLGLLGGGCNLIPRGTEKVPLGTCDP